MQPNPRFPTIVETAILAPFNGAWLAARLLKALQVHSYPGNTGVTY